MVPPRNLARAARRVYPPPMIFASKYRPHVRALLRLGLPLVGSQVAQLGMGLTDTVFLGWYDVNALAAQVLASTVFFLLFLTGSGFGWAVAPIVSEAEARGDTTEARRATRMSMWLMVLFFTLVALPIMMWSETWLLWIGQTPELASLAAQYLWIAGAGMLPALVLVSLRSYLSALERTDIVFWVTMAAVVLNALFDWLLIFGNWGLPEMGLRGAALATVAMNIASALLVGAIILRLFPDHALFTRIWRADWEVFRRVFHLGWPIGLTTLSEVGLFSMATVMMGWLGTVPLAAHGIALQISAASFMIHLGLSQAVTVRAGQAQGRRDLTELNDGAITALGLAGIAVAMTTLAFLIFPQVLIGLFLDPADPMRAAVIAAGVPLLAAAALFQLVDAAQVLVLGILRGVQDTRIPMIYAALSYWGVGLPVAYVLGFVVGWEGVGVWLGFAASLAAAAVLLSWRFWGVILPRLQAAAQAKAQS